MIRQHIQAARTNDAGFTLIELLIVVVILGVLSAVVVFAVSAFNNDGVVAACKTDVKSVEVASEAFYAKSPTGARAADIAAMVTAGYLKEEPSSTKYTIAYHSTTGAVTGTLAAGGAC
jgi:prepilin-type N-terminal cleavage/methylation domain-containing protein